MPGKACTEAVGNKELDLLRVLQEVNDEARGGKGQTRLGLEDLVNKVGSLRAGEAIDGLKQKST